MAFGIQVGRERVTVVTLARHAGVAASTVSRALKGDPRISAETRLRIEALAIESGFMPITRGLDLLEARLRDGATPDEVVSLQGGLIVHASARLGDGATA